MSWLKGEPVRYDCWQQWYYISRSTLTEEMYWDLIRGTWRHILDSTETISRVVIL